MKVFSTYFKIVKGNKALILINIIIFLVLAVGMTKLSKTNQMDLSDNKNVQFDEDVINIAVINRDSQNEITDAFIDYLDDKVKIQEIEDDDTKLSDALFYRYIEYIAIIPKGFSNDLLAGKMPKLEKLAVSGSFNEYYIDELINKYLNAFTIYQNNAKELQLSQMLTYIKSDLSAQNEVKVVVANDSEEQNRISGMAQYFNYSAYATLGALIAGICAVMCAMYKKDVRRRNLCSPISHRRIDMSLILGNFLLACGMFLFNTVIAVILYQDQVFTVSGIFMILNNFILAIVVMSLGMLVANVVKSKNAQSAATTTISLALCFLSGIFVPQDLMGNTVRNVASFLPTYWYVKANDELSYLEVFDIEKLKTVLGYMGIEILFFIAILSITLVITKQKSQGERA